MRKIKLITSTIINAVKDYLTGNSSKEAIAKKLGVSWSSIDSWVANYQSMNEPLFSVMK